MVGAVVEQVYSSTFKFRLLKIQEICRLKCFLTPLNAPKMRLVAGLSPESGPAGELAELDPPEPLAESKGRECETGGGRKGRGDRRGTEGEKERGGPPLYEVR